MVQTLVKMAGAEDFLGNPEDLDSIFEDLGIKSDLKDSQEKQENNLEKISESNGSLNPQTIQNNNTLQNQGQIVNGYIYVPAIDLYVAKKTSLKGHKFNWYKSHEELQRVNLRMPTINEFRCFLGYLLSNPKGTPDAANHEIYDILSEIFDWPKKVCYGEFLDARFIYKNKELYIAEHHKYINGRLFPQKEKPLDKCLLDKKFNKIDPLQWLDDASIDGLPKENISIGELNYFCPTFGFFSKLFKMNSVAFLRASPSFNKKRLEAIFNCNYYDIDDWSGQTVRGCFEPQLLNEGKIDLSY